MSAKDLSKIPMINENGEVNEKYIQFVANVKNQLTGSEFERHFVKIYRMITSKQIMTNLVPEKRKKLENGILQLLINDEKKKKQVEKEHVPPIKKPCETQPSQITEKKTAKSQECNRPKPLCKKVPNQIALAKFSSPSVYEPSEISTRPSATVSQKQPESAEKVVEVVKIRSSETKPGQIVDKAERNNAKSSESAVVLNGETNSRPKSSRNKKQSTDPTTLTKVSSSSVSPFPAMVSIPRNVLKQQDTAENEVETFFKKLPNSKVDHEELFDRLKSLIGAESFAVLKSMFQKSVLKSEKKKPVENSSKTSSTESTTKKKPKYMNEVQRLMIDVEDSFIGKDVTKIKQSKERLRLPKPNLNDTSSDAYDVQKRRSSESERSSVFRSSTIEKSSPMENDIDYDTNCSDGSTDGSDLILANLKRKKIRKISYSSENTTTSSESPGKSEDCDDLNLSKKQGTKCLPVTSESDDSSNSQKLQSSSDKAHIEQEKTSPTELELTHMKSAYVRLERLNIETLGLRSFHDEVMLMEENSSDSSEPRLVIDENPPEEVNEDIKPIISTMSTQFPTNFDFSQVIVIDDDEDEFIKSCKIPEPEKQFKLLNNLSFLKSTESSQVLYRCIASCDFHCSDINILKFHIERHVLIKFTGYCKICKIHIHKNISSLKDEVDHLEWHVNNEEDVMIASTKIKRRQSAAEKSPRRKIQRFSSTDTSGSPSSTSKSQMSTTLTKVIAEMPVFTMTNEIIDLDELDQIAETPCEVEKENNNNSTTVNEIEEAKARQESSPPPMNGLRIRLLPGDQLSGKITPKKIQLQPQQQEHNPQLFSLLTSPPKPHFLVPNANIQHLKIGNNPTSISAQNVFLGRVISVEGSMLPPPLRSQQVQSQIVRRFTLARNNEPIVQHIRPWLACFERDNKSVKAKLEMLNNKQCMLHSYKCMGLNCSFSSDDDKLFLDHLLVHMNTSMEDIGNFLKCSYCLFKGAVAPELVNHLVNYHRADKFTCPRCFFQSVAAMNVQLHFQKYHDKFMTSSAEFFYNRPSYPLLNSEFEIALVKSNKNTYVNPIKCSECPYSSHSFGGFFVHITSKHAKLIFQKCDGCNLTMTKLENMIEHLKKCCQIFKFNCLLCKFGASEAGEIANHYVDNHPSNSMIFSEREYKLPVSENPDEQSYVHLPIRFVKCTISRSNDSQKTN